MHNGMSKDAPTSSVKSGGGVPDLQVNLQESNKMLVKSGQPELSAEQTEAMDRVWGDPKTASFGGLEG